MIKLRQPNLTEQDSDLIVGSGLSSFPPNLVPYIFKCKKCGCTIRKVLETDSYILMLINRDIDLGKTKICPFCYKLREYNLLGT